MTSSEIPYATEQGIFGGLTGNSLERTGNLIEGVSVHFSHACSASNEQICSRLRFEDGGNDMADEHRTWRRQDEGFWRAHHEAWKRSDLNQRQYCEAEGIPLKAFGN